MRASKRGPGPVGPPVPVRTSAIDAWRKYGSRRVASHSPAPVPCAAPGPAWQPGRDRRPRAPPQCEPNGCFSGRPAASTAHCVVVSRRKRLRWRVDWEGLRTPMRWADRVVFAPFGSRVGRGYLGRCGDPAADARACSARSAETGTVHRTHGADLRVRAREAPVEYACWRARRQRGEHAVRESRGSKIFSARSTMTRRSVHACPRRLAVRRAAPCIRTGRASVRPVNGRCCGSYRPGLPSRMRRSRVALRARGAVRLCGRRIERHG